MTISSNAATLCGVSVIVAAGAAAGGGGGGGGGGGDAAAGDGAYELGVRSSDADGAPDTLRACSSAKSSRREVAASSLSMTQSMDLVGRKYLGSWELG
jgi:hypothetical protein